MTLCSQQVRERGARARPPWPGSCVIVEAGSEHSAPRIRLTALPQHRRHGPHRSQLPGVRQQPCAIPNAPSAGQPKPRHRCGPHVAHVLREVLPDLEDLYARWFIVRSFSGRATARRRPVPGRRTGDLDRLPDPPRERNLLRLSSTGPARRRGRLAVRREWTRTRTSSSSRPFERRWPSACHEDRTNRLTEVSDVVPTTDELISFADLLSAVRTDWEIYKNRPTFADFPSIRTDTGQRKLSQVLLDSLVRNRQRKPQAGAIHRQPMPPSSQQGWKRHYQDGWAARGRSCSQVCRLRRCRRVRAC